MWGDREWVLQRLLRDGCDLRHANEDLRNDREIVYTAVRTSGSALQYAPWWFRNDREIVYAAVRSDPASIKYATGADFTTGDLGLNLFHSALCDTSESHVTPSRETARNHTI